MIQSDVILNNINKNNCENIKKNFINCMREKPSQEKIKKCRIIFNKYTKLCENKKL